MRTRQSIRRVPFVAPFPMGIEVTTFARLRAEASSGALMRPLRPEFHSLLMVTDGTATHAVDSVPHVCEPGSVLWIRPSQVQRFSDADSAADVILFQPEFLIPGTHAAAIADDRRGVVSVDGSRSSASQTRHITQILRGEYAAAVAEGERGVVHAETLRHLLSALILSLGPSERDRPSAGGLAADFAGLVERDFGSAHDVDHYARRLGYSQRSLNRAVQDAVGQSPKQVIDQRIALEAGRLLAHTGRPVATIAKELGFSDPSNFSSFFARRTRMSPSTFRRRMTGDGPGGG